MMATSGPSNSLYTTDTCESGCNCEKLIRQINSHVTSLKDAIEEVDDDIKTTIEAVQSNRDAIVNVIDDSTKSIINDIENCSADFKSGLQNDVATLERLMLRLQQTSKVVSEPERQKYVDEIKQNLESQISCKHSTRPVINFHPSTIKQRILSGLYKVGILKCAPRKPASQMNAMNIQEFRRANSSYDPGPCCEEDSFSSSSVTMSSLSLTSCVTSSSEDCQSVLKGKYHHFRNQQLANNACGISNITSFQNECGAFLPQMGIQARHRSVEELSYISEPGPQSETSSCSDNCGYLIAKTSDIKELNVNHLSAKTRCIQNNAITSNYKLNITNKYSDNEGTDVDRRHPLSCRYFASLETQRHRTPCVIPDFTWLDDERIVLADHYHNNIQLFDENMRFVTEESCAYPMGVCSINKDVIAVTLRRNGSIVIYKAETDQLTLMRSIDVVCESYLWNVVYKSGRLYVMCDENNVHNLDLYGTCRRIIRTGISTECGYIRYFDVSDNGLLLFLCTERWLICISTYGEQLWKFSGENLPPSVYKKNTPILESVHFHDNRLLATHWTQSVILEITTDGRYVKHLITGGLQNPRAIDIRNGKLAVTQFHPTMMENRKRTVKIFKISTN